MEVEARIRHRDDCWLLLSQADEKEHALVDVAHDYALLMLAEEKIIARLARKVAERDALVARERQLQNVLASTGLTTDERLDAESRLVALPAHLAVKQAEVEPLEAELAAKRAEMRDKVVKGSDCIAQLEQAVDGLRWQAAQPFREDEAVEPVAPRPFADAAPNVRLGETLQKLAIDGANEALRRQGVLPTKIPKTIGEAIRQLG